jgi:hypothetical protein
VPYFLNIFFGIWNISKKVMIQKKNHICGPKKKRDTGSVLWSCVASPENTPQTAPERFPQDSGFWKHWSIFNPPIFFLY